MEACRKWTSQLADLLIFLYRIEYRSSKNSYELRACIEKAFKLWGCNCRVCKYVDNLSFLQQTLDKFVLLIILTWSGVRSLRKILQKKRLKRRHILSSAREKGKESNQGQRVKNHGNVWLTSTKRQVSTEEKTLWGRVLVVTTVTKRL